MKIATVDFWGGEPNSRVWNHKRDFLDAFHERGIESKTYWKRQLFSGVWWFWVGYSDLSEILSCLYFVCVRAQKAVEWCRLTCFPCRET